MPLCSQKAGVLWRVVRLDENVNRFPVADTLSEAAADRLVAAYEGKGHKQTYFKERQPCDQYPEC